MSYATNKYACKQHNIFNNIHVRHVRAKTPAEKTDWSWQIEHSYAKI